MNKWRWILLWWCVVLYVVFFWGIGLSMYDEWRPYLWATLKVHIYVLVGWLIIAVSYLLIKMASKR